MQAPDMMGQCTPDHTVKKGFNKKQPICSLGMAFDGPQVPFDRMRTRGAINNANVDLWEVWRNRAMS